MEVSDNSSQTPLDAGEGVERGLPSWAIWVGVVLVIVLCHIKFLFVDAHVETGDYAANALQIRSAKHFQEIHGNYSRWGFHHPGPAFFYVYAAGEWVFRDLLRVVPSPFNAHVLAGILLQSGFFAWALCIVRRRAPHPIVMPLLLVLGGLHFTAVSWCVPDSLFASIWAPQVLLFPFLCFVVSCASFAAGEGRDAIPATLAGCFLVHGHVAQPLFVAPFFLIALLSFLRQSRVVNGSIRAAAKRHKNPLIVSLVIIGIALVPLAIDAAAGDQSNLQTILKHFTTHSSDRKLPLASLIYLATFFCYIPNPETFCDRINGDSFDFLTARWQFAVAWAIVIALVLIFARTILRKNRFARWLYAYAALALIFTFIWGMLQNGSMMNFNAHFNFGLIFLLLMLFALLIFQWIRADIRKSTTVALSFVGLLFFIPVTRGWNLRSDLPTLAFAPTLSNELEEAVRTDGKRAKFLIFPHPSWPVATGLALALQRAGSEYAVSREWAFMFDRRRSQGYLETVTSPDAALWRLGKPSAGSAGFGLVDGTFVVTAGPQLNPEGAEITFIGPEANAAQYSILGWMQEGEKVGQLVDVVGVLEFRPTLAERDVEIVVWLRPGESALPREAQALTISFNGEELARAPLNSGNKIKVIVPRETWNRKSVARLVFRPSAPPSANGVKDGMTIGFEKVTFGLAPN